MKKQKELEHLLKNLNNINYSLVFFTPAQKINFYIDKFKKYFLDRKIVIAKEMTKIHEEFIRDGLELIKRFPESLKGELKNCLSKLSIDFRNIIILRDIQELSYDEISTIIELPLGIL